MPSLVANIAGTILGVGSVATAVAVPLSLKNLSIREVGSTSQQVSEVSNREAEQHSEPQDQEIQQKLEGDDFKNYCYGGFLKQEREGELLACVKPSEGSSLPPPIFYLQWGEKPNLQYGLVKKVNSLMQRESWKINFELDDSKGSKTLTIPVANQGVLNWLNAKSHKELQGYCKLSAKNSEGDYQLECTKGTRTTYKRVVTKVNID